MLGKVLSVFALALTFLAGYEVNTLIGHSPVLVWVVVVGVMIIALLVSLLVVRSPKRRRRIYRSAMPYQPIAPRRKAKRRTTVRG